MENVIKHTPQLWEKKIDNESVFLFWCPGCGRGHTFHTPRWSFNGDVARPTFSPSLKVYIPSGDDRPNDETVCHLFVTNGKIVYCSDSPHELKGTEIILPNIPNDYGF